MSTNPTLVNAVKDSELLKQLHEKSKKQPKLIRSSTYDAPAAPEMKVRSWKMNEFKYYDIPSPFPTLARGLFTLDGENERIVARGYDKFFNIGEVPWTMWESLKNHTEAPYDLTLKSNGCIIFIAALTPDKLLVTSKHSLGPIGNAPISHAQMGEQWLEKHLESKGKSKEQFAQILWDNKWTAVAELCDDSFEEHVLPYSKEKTGLHLHGVNVCTGDFHTLPPQKINDIADNWGFIRTVYTTMQSVDEVKTFTDDVAKSGAWNGEPLEGFVVRTRIRENKTTGDRRSTPPYPPDTSFFFKVKFDEPYMMYRDWRELTKKLLSSKGGLENAKVPRARAGRPETKQYKEWVMNDIRNNRALYKDYTKNKGIIATRERFLEYRKSLGDNTDFTLANEVDKLKLDEKKEFGKTIIAPIAIPGCGKTTIAVALKEIFNFGHTQSDDVKAKKPAPQFIKNVKKLLDKNGVVIADKNNHLEQHREQLRELANKYSPPARLLALNWALDKPTSTIHRVCGDRIADRGENHQTLLGDVKTKAHEDVVWRFIHDSQPLSDSEVDEVIDLDVEESLEDMLSRSIEGITRILKLPQPDTETVGRGLAAARSYQAVTRAEPAKNKSFKPPRYFGILPELDLVELLDPILTSDSVDKAVHNFWANLKKSDRVAKRPHITITHEKARGEEGAVWDACSTFTSLPTSHSLSFDLGSVLCNDRIMAVTVEDLSAGEDDEAQAKSFVDALTPPVRSRLHITVGGKDANVNPFEARALVESWRKTKSHDTHSVKLDGVHTQGRLKGLFS